jgi:hypothetical protein
VQTLLHQQASACVQAALELLLAADQTGRAAICSFVRYCFEDGDVLVMVHCQGFDPRLLSVLEGFIPALHDARLVRAVAASNPVFAVHLLALLHPGPIGEEEAGQCLAQLTPVDCVALLSPLVSLASRMPGIRKAILNLLLAICTTYVSGAPSVEAEVREAVCAVFGLVNCSPMDSFWTPLAPLRGSPMRLPTLPNTLTP